MDELKALVKLVSDSVDRIEKSCQARNVTFPSLNEVYSLQTEAARLDPAVLKAAADISAATAQLSALVRHAPLTLITTSRQHFVSSALGFVNEVNVAEILRDSGSKGVHIDEIAQKAGVNANKLGRCLRLLATEHIFVEVAPGVFANNRISSVLDSGKDIKDLLERPEEKYDGTDGVSALLKHNVEHGLKSSAYLADTLKDPETTHSFAVTKTAFNKAYRTDLPQWSWFELPEQKADLRAFGIAMRGSATLQLHDALLDCLEWSNLPAGSKFVDVGGGVGTQTMILARSHPHLKYFVQDRAETLVQARRVWKEKYPEAIEKELVTFQPTNFLSEQPITDASVFFMRSILHDWPDDECIQILKVLRATARPQTQLIVKGIVVQYASSGTTPLTNVPQNHVPTPPAPLLANGGHANAFDYLIDMHMMLLMNGQERTLEHLNELLQQSGWQLSRIFREPYYYTGGLQHVVAVPA